MELNTIISKNKIQKYHYDFEKTKKSKLRKKLMFLRINVNRIIQSIRVIGSTPLLWPHLIKGSFKAFTKKENNLRCFEIAMTYNCNSRCEQCSCRLAYDPKRERNERLTVKEMKNAIDQAIELGAFHLVLNGGEPLLEYERVLEIIKYVKKKDHYTHLCTNGVLLNEEKIIALKKAGLNSLEMGFDSAFEEIHDKNRIRGSFKKILDNIELCKKHKIRVVLNTILTNNKVKSDDIIYTFLLAKKLGCLLQITPCCLTGAFKNRLDIKLTDEAKLYFFWLLSKSMNNRSDLYSSLTTIKCPAAREKIALQPYGDVVSCPLIQITYGNIRKQPLKEIQKEMLKNPYYHINKMEGCLPAMSDDFIYKYLVDKNEKNK